ncbi:MAG TPA: DUF3298 domain-containing protein [bacterium]|nr:DUF3298 domain-containing protein [bacterium]
MLLRLPAAVLLLAALHLAVPAQAAVTLTPLTDNVMLPVPALLPGDTATGQMHIDLTYLMPQGDTAAARIGRALHAAFFFAPVWGDGEDSRPFPAEPAAALADFRGRIVAEYQAAMAGGDTEMPLFARCWEYEQRLELHARARGTLTLAQSFITYTGGAHGLYGVSYLVFDEETGERIGLADLFTPGSDTRITRHLERCFRTANDIPDTQPLAELLNVATIPVTDNFSLDETGITFRYNPYAIACYAAGAIDITVPWPMLQDCLCPDGISLRFRPTGGR